jgi:hypothetical protein
MAKRDNPPGPGVSTAEDAVSKIKKEVAARNEAAHKADRAKTDPREKAAADKRRRDSW